MSQHFGPFVPTSGRLPVPRTLEQELKALSPEVRQWLASAIEDIWESRRRETADEMFPQLLDPQVGTQLDAIRAMLTGRLSQAGRDRHTEGMQPRDADQGAVARRKKRAAHRRHASHRWAYGG